MTYSSPPPPAFFRPVQMQRVRHDGWTPARQELFLIYLERLGLVSVAARAVGMSPKSAYALFNRSETTQPNDTDVPTFAEAWRGAVQTGQDNAAQLAIQRSITGEIRPVFYRGRQVGERRVFDNRLLCAALRTHRRGENHTDLHDELSSFLGERET